MAGRWSWWAVGLGLALGVAGCDAAALGSRSDAGAGEDTGAGDAGAGDVGAVDAGAGDAGTAADAAMPDDAWSATPDDAWSAPSDDAWSAPPDDAWVAPPTDAGVACPSYAGPTRPSSCPLDAEVVVYSQNGWNALADAIAAEPSDCAEYWIDIAPISGDSTMLRAGEADRMHARGVPSLHALAEFHWGDWSAYHASTGTSWTDIGHLFRQRMVDAGYCVESGDTWAINEAPTSTRLDTGTTRADLIELVRALDEGMPGMPPARGAVFVINFGQGTSTGSVYQGNLESWLTDATFWGQMNLHVRFWAQEVYTDPDFTCVPGSTLAARATHVNEFTEHPARLAAAAPTSAGANTAQTYFGRAYVPLMNAFWGSTTAYGNTSVPLATMEAFISEQVYATRLWADTHAYPDGRIGFGFGSAMTPSEWTTLGQRIARAIRGAYGRSASASGACYEGTSSVWCSCSVSGATFSSVWTGFGTW